MNTHKTKGTKKIILASYNRLGVNYSYDKLVAEMDVGFWRYLFAKPQFNADGKTLLKVSPCKPMSKINIQYNQTFVFQELEKIYKLRNRLAYHKAVSFKLAL